MIPRLRSTPIRHASLLLLAIACGDPTGPAAIATLTMNVTSATVFLGDTKQLTVTPKDAAGVVVSAVPAWNSSNQAVATVTPGGLVTAVSVGETTITATVPSGASATATITVSSLVAGKWQGLLDGLPLTLTLVEGAGIVTGSGTLTIPGEGPLVVTATGVWAKPTASITIAMQEFQPFNFQATVTATQMTGTVNGSGFVNQPLTLARQP